VKEPDKAVTTHQAKIRLIKDHYKEAQCPVATRSPVMRTAPGPAQHLPS
jgi:hypothetical protein